MKTQEYFNDLMSEFVWNIDLASNRDEFKAELFQLTLTFNRLMKNLGQPISHKTDLSKFHSISNEDK